jgi:hypothetical protein
VSKSNHEPSVGLPAHRLRRVILSLCLLRHTSRRLAFPLLVQSCDSHDCSTLPLFCCRYFGDCRHATHGPDTPALATRIIGTLARVTDDPNAPPAPRKASVSPLAPRAASASLFAPRATSASRFAQRLLVYQRQHLVPALEPSCAGQSVYHLISVASDPRSTHPMVTRRVAGVTKPVDCLQLSTVAAPPTLSTVPTSVRSMLVDPHCRCAMEEYEVCCPTTCGT